MNFSQGFALAQDPDAAPDTRALTGTRCGARRTRRRPLHWHQIPDAASDTRPPAHRHQMRRSKNQEPITAPAVMTSSSEAER